MSYIKSLCLSLIVFTLCISCFDDKDDVPQLSSETDIKDFVWRGLNFWYVYKADVPDLADNRFTSTQEREAFLTNFSSPEATFDALLTDTDEFSFIVDDYIALEQAFNGVTLNNGMDFRLVRYPNDPSNIFGYVRYVLPNSDADQKGIQRGMVFNTINGTQLTDQNSVSLLSSDTYTIGLANFDGENIEPTNTTITLSKTQYTENPIFIAKTITIGSSPVGYLMYNSFTASFDSQLNAAFAKFKSDGVQHLILDLRYNPGGDTETAKDLASMITGQFNAQVFSTKQWNADRQSQFASAANFDTQIRTGEAINSLNLTEVYVLTSKSSASASELVINGLDPYINVIQVGANTRGKFQASVTIYDADNFSRSGANPGHTYALQPLVLTLSNAVGFTNFVDGLTPEITLEEDLTNLGVLGDPNEPLLKRALDDIAGTVTRSASSSIPNFNTTNIERRMIDDPTFLRMYITP